MYNQKQKKIVLIEKEKKNIISISEIYTCIFYS